MLNKDMPIDKSTPIPLYYQLKNLILDEIKAGNYKPDDLIPTENEISEMFGISRTTVRQAILELVSEGWLYRIKSKGTFVSRPKIQQDFIKKLESFNDQITRSGMVPSTEVLELSVVPAEGYHAQYLGINEGDKVIRLFRKRCADGKPIVTIKTFLSYDTCAFVMTGHDLEKESLYSILRTFPETTVVKIDRTIEAIEASKEDAKLLDYKEGRAIHFFKSVGYNSDGKPIELSYAHYRGDQNSFEVTVYT